MTKKDFFILIIKLFGLYSLVTYVFSILPNNMSFLLVDPEPRALIGLGSILVIVCVIYGLLISNAHRIVSLLGLERGFDNQRIELSSIRSFDLVKIGIFLIGALIIAQNIPYFLGHTFFAFKDEATGKDYSSIGNFQWLTNLGNVILGYLIMTHYQWLAKVLYSSKDEGEIGNT